MRIEMELRNVPRFRVMEYLQETGGLLTGELAVQGEGWQASLVPLDPVQLFTMVIPRDLLVIEGHEDAVSPIQAFMRRKTMRGGG